VADDPEHCVIKGIAMASKYTKMVENKKGHEINPLLAAY
jgi:hypothetical protein